MASRKSRDFPGRVFLEHKSKIPPSLYGRPRHKKPDFFKDVQSMRRVLEILGIFRKKKKDFLVIFR